MAEALKIAVSNGITIEKGLPIPQGAGRRGGNYPWSAMEVGDSFLFPAGTKGTNAQNTAASAGRSRGWRFVTRRVDGDRFRVWRIA